MIDVDRDDLREAVRRMVGMNLRGGHATAEECERALGVIEASDGWMEDCGEWRLVGVVQSILEWGEANV